MSNYITTEGQTLYDIALSIYGDENAFSSLLSLNPLINLNNTIATNSVIVYDETLKFKKKPTVSTLAKAPRPFWVVRELQSVYDLALQLYGNTNNLDKIFGLVTTDLNNPLTVGMLVYPADTNSFIALFFANSAICTFNISQIGINNIILLEAGSPNAILTEGGFNILKE